VKKITTIWNIETIQELLPIQTEIIEKKTIKDMREIEMTMGEEVIGEEMIDLIKGGMILIALGERSLKLM